MSNMSRAEFKKLFLNNADAIEDCPEAHDPTIAFQKDISDSLLKREISLGMWSVTDDY